MDAAEVGVRLADLESLVRGHREVPGDRVLRRTDDRGADAELARIEVDGRALIGLTVAERIRDPGRPVARILARGDRVVDVGRRVEVDEADLAPELDGRHAYRSE